jgi:hypothetical protein
VVDVDLVGDVVVDIDGDGDRDVDATVDERGLASKVASTSTSPSRSTSTTTTTTTSHINAADQPSDSTLVGSPRRPTRTSGCPPTGSDKPRCWGLPGGWSLFQ